VPFSNGTYPTDADIRQQIKDAYNGVLGTPTSVVILNCRNFQPTNMSNCATEDVRPGRSGDLVTVTITWDVPGLEGMQGLINAIPGPELDVTGLSTVTQTARARRE
jgi:hypothetical protein